MKQLIEALKLKFEVIKYQTAKLVDVCEMHPINLNYQYVLYL